MDQETIAHIMAIEQDAAKLHDDARRKGAQMIEEAEKTSADSREKTLDRAHHKADQIVAKGHEEAEVERARIIASAGAEAQHLETMAAQNLELAVNFILAQITRRE